MFYSNPQINSSLRGIGGRMDVEYVQIAHVSQILPSGRIAHFVGRIAVIVLGGDHLRGLTLVDVRDFYDGEWVLRSEHDCCIRLDWEEEPHRGSGILDGEALKIFRGGHFVTISDVLAERWKPFDPNCVGRPTPHPGCVCF
jgi:hypothetical protein